MQREVDAPERLHSSRALAEKLDDAMRLHNRFTHRPNTIAGSMRRTLTIEASAEMTHITRVNKNSTPVNLGVMWSQRARFGRVVH